jgi:hypothetical protein
MNKMLYAKEGAKEVMDRTCADLPWQLRVEVDGVEIYIPEDSEGILIINIGSYMGGVDLWQNEEEHEDEFDTQSMHDKLLEVVGICGTWHLGKLQVNSPTFGSFPILKTPSTPEYTALILRSVLKLVDLMMDSVLYR